MTAKTANNPESLVIATYDDNPNPVSTMNIV